MPAAAREFDVFAPHTSPDTVGPSPSMHYGDASTHRGRSQPMLHRLADACCDNLCGQFLWSFMGYDKYGRLSESSSVDLVERAVMDRDGAVREQTDDLEMGLLRDPASSVDSLDSGDARDSPSTRLIHDRPMVSQYAPPQPPGLQINTSGPSSAPGTGTPRAGALGNRQFVTHFDVDADPADADGPQRKPGAAPFNDPPKSPDPAAPPTPPTPPKVKLPAPASLTVASPAGQRGVGVPQEPTMEPLRQPMRQPMAVVPANQSQQQVIAPAPAAVGPAGGKAARSLKFPPLPDIVLSPTSAPDLPPFDQRTTPIPAAPVEVPQAPPTTSAPSATKTHNDAAEAPKRAATPTSFEPEPEPQASNPAPTPPSEPAAAPEAEETAGEEMGDAEGELVDCYRDAVMPVDENDEPIDDYREGGYHPVALGVVFNGRFRITDKLGWGMYSTVWMAEDQQRSTLGSTQRVALKLQKSSEDYYQAAVNEIKLLKAVREAADARSEIKPFVVRLIDAFDVVGPNGTHPCMVFEPLGESLFGVLQAHNQVPFPAVRRITAQLLRGLAFLHSCKILHTDLKPENVLVVRCPPDAAPDERDVIRLSEDDFIVGVKIVDLGNAFFEDEQDVYDIQTREYRCIESMLGIWPFKPAADVWSLGCLAFELVTGETLFDPQLPPDVDPSALEEGDFIKDESHLHQCLELVGPIPPHVIQRGERSPDWFDEDGTMRSMPDPVSSEGIIVEVLMQNFEIEPQPAQITEAFVKYTLCYDPDDRPSADECMKHPFVDDH